MDPNPPAWLTISRRQAAKERRRAERAGRAAAIETAWVTHMYAETPAEKAANAAARAARVAEKAARFDAVKSERAAAVSDATAHAFDETHLRDARKALDSGRRFPNPVYGKTTPSVTALAHWLDRERPESGEFSLRQVRWFRDTYRAAVWLREEEAGRNT